jgi:diguanylate cyclase (GGDEF)-like protein
VVGPTGVEEFEAAERSRLLRIERLILYVCIGTCTVMAGLGALVNDPWALYISVVGVFLLGAALVLNFTGRLQATAFVMATIALLMVTLTAATGDGLYDLSMMAYPAILLFAGMTLRPRDFALFIVLVVCAVSFVAINQSTQVLATRPGETPPAAALTVSLAIMSITVFAVALLATSHRRALSTAHHEISRRVKVEAELADLSLKDALTGVSSRRAYDVELERLRVSRLFPVSVLIADIDNLKRVNDTSGHRAGDRLIMRASRVLSSAVRAEDLIARIGGDEFAVLLAESDESAVRGVLERVEHALANPEDPSELSLNLSVGVATARSDADLDDAIASADRMMYDHKSAKKLAG